MRRLLVGISLVTAISTISVPIQTQAQNVQGWFIRQNSEYHGAIQLRASAKGTRLDAKNLSIFVTPDSTAHVYNNDNKTFCQLSRQIWLDKYSLGTTNGPPVKGLSGVIAGHKCTQYFCGSFLKNATKPRFGYEFWACNDLGLPAQVANEYSALIGLPRGLGLPLKVIRHYPAKGARPARTTLFLDTISVTPQVLTAAQLKAPVGYRQMPDEMDVILADELDELGLDGGKTPRR